MMSWIKVSVFLDHIDEISEQKIEFSKISLKVLIVDDNTISRKLAKGILEKQNFDVMTASSGSEAIEKVRDNEFNLILMDCQMPVLDGFETTMAIREIEQELGRYTPIIALTALAMKGDRERCLAAGMDEYISKPILIEKLFRAISNVIDQNDKRKNLSSGLPV